MEAGGAHRDDETTAPTVMSGVVLLRLLGKGAFECLARRQAAETSNFEGSGLAERKWIRYAGDSNASGTLSVSGKANSIWGAGRWVTAWSCCAERNSWSARFSS